MARQRLRRVFLRFRRKFRSDSAFRLTVLLSCGFLGFMLMQTHQDAAMSRKILEMPPKLTSSFNYSSASNILVKVWFGPRDRWQTVSAKSHKVFVYSAYLDRRLATPMIRVIGVCPYKLFPSLSCIVRYKTTNTVVPARVVKLKENWGLPYTACFLMCELRTVEPPSLVTITKDLSDDVTNAIQVQSESPANPRKGKFAICVKPFHYNYNRAVWLVEFIEVHRILGISHFIFYNHTVGPDVQKVLENYNVEGIVSILQWELPVKSQKEIRTEGIFAALNDCSYRTMYRYDYVFMIDLDEYVLPRTFRDYHELFDSYQNSDIGAYSFQNCFFYLYWDNDTRVWEQTSASAEMPYLITLFKTRRMDHPHPHSIRSKYAVLPDRVVEVGNHKVWKFIGKNRHLYVEPEVALSHHYRICEFGGFDCLKHPSHVDRTAHKYMPQVIQQVSSSCRRIFNGSCPAAPPLGSPW